jgi:hypothetical protein
MLTSGAAQITFGYELYTAFQQLLLEDEELD